MPSQWKTGLDPSRLERARLVVADLGHRLRDADTIDEVRRSTTSATREPSTHWYQPGLASGYAGLALTCGQLDRCFPGQGWDVVAHRYLAAAVASGAAVPGIGSSLFGGLAGLGFVALQLSRNSSRYATLMSNVDSALTAGITALCDQADSTEDGCAAALFDLVSGLAGLAAYLLALRDAGRDHLMLKPVLNSLSGLMVRGGARPAWFTPAALLPQTMKPAYPSGNINCGLAHGGPGALAILAIAKLSGCECRSLDEAIYSLGNWTAQNAIRNGRSINWPTGIPLDGCASHATRLAWCYGAPGVARALWLGGQAVDEGSFRALALDTIRALSCRTASIRKISSPTFCHGIAGLLQIALRFSLETGEVSDLVDSLTDELLERFEPDTMLGYRDVEMSGNQIERAGLLEGMPGVLLVLLGATFDVEPTWDRAFALS